MSKQQPHKRKDGKGWGESRQHDTFVFPDECVSAECRAEVDVPQIVTREPPKPKYLRYQVEDERPRGFSTYAEVEETAAQILQDVMLGVIDRVKGIQRLNAVRAQAKARGRDELRFPRADEVVDEIIDKYLTRVRRQRWDGTETITRHTVTYSPVKESRSRKTLEKKRKKRKKRKD